MNKCLFTGRLARDPESRQGNSGMSVTKFCVAVEQGWGDNKKTAFCDVTAFKQTAEFVRDYCRKGGLVGVECQVTQENWQDKTSGAKRSKIVFIADRVESLERREQQPQQAPQQQYQTQYQQAPPLPRQAPPPPPFNQGQAAGAAPGTPSGGSHLPRPADQREDYNVSDESIDTIPF